MADQTLSADNPSESVCPWCSAAIVPGSPTCASCGASLESEEDRDVPGLTAVDMAILRGEKKEQPAPSRNRLLSWISGDYPEEANAAGGDTAALAPPDLEVRREILRLELEAEVANLQAEADALRAEMTIEGHAPDATDKDAAAAEQVVAEVDAIEAELEHIDVALDTDPLVPIATEADAEPATEPVAEAASDAGATDASDTETPDADAPKA